MTFFSGIDIKPDADDRRDRVGGRQVLKTILDIG